MSRLLAAEGIVLQKHFLQYVAVTDLGGNEPKSVRLAEFSESEVGHDRSHHGRAIELAAVVQIQRADCHDHVAVDQLAFFVYTQTTVRVSVEGNAAIQAVLKDVCGEGFHVSRSAVAIDVDTVGGAVQYVNLRAKLAEQRGSCDRCRAVGAVDGDLQAVQTTMRGALDVTDVVRGSILGVRQLADLTANGGCHDADLVEHDFLDPFLQHIG